METQTMKWRTIRSAEFTTAVSGNLLWYGFHGNRLQCPWNRL